MVLYIPSAPVEEKGYKSMINLPDWLNIHNKIIKIRKSFENRRFFLFPTCPFSEVNKGDAYAIRFFKQSDTLCILIHSGIGYMH